MSTSAAELLSMTWHAEAGALEVPECDKSSLRDRLGRLNLIIGATHRTERSPTFK